MGLNKQQVERIAIKSKLIGLGSGTNATITDDDDVLGAFENIQAQLNYLLGYNHEAVSIDSTANGLGITSDQVLSLALASTSSTGALSSSDWNIFNGKQNALGFTPINKAGDSGISGNLLFNNGLDLDTVSIGDSISFGGVNAGTVNIGTSSHTTVVNIGTGNVAKVFNFGGNIYDIFNFTGNAFVNNATDLQVADKLVRYNVGGSAGSAYGSGFEVEEGGVVTGYFKTTGGRDGWLLKAPGNAYETSFIFSPTAARQVTFQNATGTVAYLSDVSTKENTITAGTTAQYWRGDKTWQSLSNDVRALLSGTTNRISFDSSTGVFDISTSYSGQNTISTLGTITTGVWNGSSISDPYISSATTWNNKVTSISGVSNRTTISGTTTVPIIDIHSSYVGQSSITTLGTITTGVWNGTTVGVGNGGTGTSTTFTQGSVLFAGASGVYSQNNGNLFWDNTNNRLGIGTALPSTKLDVVSTSNTNMNLITYNASGLNNRSSFNFIRYRGTEASPATTVLGDVLGSLFWAGYTGSTVTNIGSIQVVTSSSFVDAGYMAFGVKNHSDTAPVEVMRLTEFRNVFIGTTTGNSRLHISQPTTSVGTISVTAGSGTVTGSGTQFQNVFKIGDTITANGETRTITAIASDVSMTTDAWTNTASAQTYTLVGGDIFTVKGNGNTIALGNLLINTIGKGLQVKGGTNSRIGQATLVGGTVTVNNTSVTSTTRIFVTVSTAGGTQGYLKVSKVAGTSFTIQSTSVLETSTVDWCLIEEL